MKLKKILAVLCVCALALSLAIPVFADAIENGSKVVFDGTIADEKDEGLEVAVAVLYGNIHKLYVNPYGLPFTIKDGVITAPVQGDDGQVTDQPTGETIKEGTTTNGWFSHTAVIKNLSRDELDVKVTFTMELNSSNVKVVEYDLTNPQNPVADIDPNFNCLYGTFQITKATMSKTKEISATNWTIHTETDGDMYEIAIPASDSVPTSPTATGFKLAGATPPTGTATEDTPAYAAFRIRGGATINADGAASDATNSNIANEWGEDDTVNMTISFSFN